MALLRRVEPPPPWTVVGELQSFEDELLVPYALGAWAKQGLAALADDYEERGNRLLADFWRSKIRELGEVNIAGVDLAVTVADGLRDLANLYANQGYLLLQQRWLMWVEFIGARAWQRVRVAHRIADAH